MWQNAFWINFLSILFVCSGKKGKWFKTIFNQSVNSVSTSHLKLYHGMHYVFLFFFIQSTSWQRRCPMLTFLGARTLTRLLRIILFGYDFVSLCSIPAVLCSNNWQSAVSNAANQPSTSDHVAKEPVRLNRVTPGPIVVNQLPEFDQDSWTINPPFGTGRTTTDSPANTQPPDQTNNNNNNNTFFSNGHPTDSNSTVGRTADRAAAATTNWTSSLATTASPPSEPSGTSNESQTVDAVASETITTDDMAVEPLTTNSMAAEPQPINETRELPAINGEDAQESSTDSQVVVL